jgi:hypothetical protein
MSKYSEIFEYMRTCPALDDLWSIGAVEAVDAAVILPQGASPSVQYQESIDVVGNYEAIIEPYPSVYEDYQINCFKFYDAKDDSSPNANINVMSLDEVQSICDWVAEQNANNNLPRITGKQVVSIECNPFVPQIRYVNEQENIIAYFITVRIRYVNPTRRKSVVFDAGEN